MEELLTGEVEQVASLIGSRASTLLSEVDLLTGKAAPDAAEIAATALRALALPAIAERRANLLPEVNLHSRREEGPILVARCADAVAHEDGQPSVVLTMRLAAD